MDLADARGIKKFVHTSSSGTIGAKPDGSPGDEESAPSDFAIENLYFRSKVTGETKIRAFVPAHGMQIIEILPGWMWGPGDEAPTAAGQLAKDFLARKLPAIPPGGANVVDARDVAAAMIECVDHARHGARYVVAGPEKTIADVVASLERVSGVRGPRLRVPYVLALVVACFSELRAWVIKRPALITRMGLKTMNRAARVSSARAQRELGVTFRPFDETARDVIAWYRSAQPV
jgi:dihydroflavonol-4-reductase